MLTWETAGSDGWDMLACERHNSAILQATFSALAMPVQYPGGKRGWVWILNMQHQQAFAVVRTLS